MAGGPKHRLFDSTMFDPNFRRSEQAAEVVVYRASVSGVEDDYSLPFSIYLVDRPVVTDPGGREFTFRFRRILQFP